MADASFDVVSKVDRQEVDNALNQTGKELSQRFDFRGTNATIAWAGEEGVTLQADTEERVAAREASWVESWGAGAARSGRSRRSAASRSSDHPRSCSARASRSKTTSRSSSITPPARPSATPSTRTRRGRGTGSP